MVIGPTASANLAVTLIKKNLYVSHVLQTAKASIPIAYVMTTTLDSINSPTIVRNVKAVRTENFQIACALLEQCTKEMRDFVFKLHAPQIAMACIRDVIVEIPKVFS